MQIEHKKHGISSIFIELQLTLFVPIIQNEFLFWQDIELNFIKREYDNLLEMQDCANIVRLMKGREYQVSKDELRIDLLFEYCPHDLQKLIANKNIIFQLSEIKAFLRQILNGLNGMHSKMVRLSFLSTCIFLKLFIHLFYA